MKDWITQQNPSAVSSILICLVTWAVGYLADESVLRFLSLLFLGHGVLILFLEWLKGLAAEPEVGEVLILDREDGKRTAQEVAFSSMLVYDSLVEVMELKGIATRREIENRMNEIKKRYKKE
jgi:hypothetical protein